MVVATLMLELPEGQTSTSFVYVVNKLLQSSDLEFRMSMVQEETIDEKF